MQCPNDVVYHTTPEQKRHAQSVARKKCMGMPKLRDLLREKCRIRIINSRRNNVDGNRKLHLDELDQILRMELQELDQDLELEQHIYDELLSDVNEWYALNEKHMEALLVEYETDPSQLPLICPVCQKKVLQRFNDTYSCECGVHFQHEADTPHLHHLIQERINQHELNCTQVLVFFIEAQGTSSRLFAICGSCDYCSSV